MRYDTQAEDDLARYMSVLDGYDRRQEQIEERTEQLLRSSSDYTWFIPSNLYEAMGEMSVDDAKKHAGMLVSGGFDEAGRFLADIAKAYWRERAKWQAENDYDNADCSYCHDAGCRRCRCDD